MAVVLKDVFSSNVSQVGYDHDAQELHVIWNTGKHSVYIGVPPALAENASTAHSVGKFLMENIKGQYEHSYVTN